MTRSGTEEWLAQVRRGVLELAVLSLIAPGAKYGYEIVSTLAGNDQLAAAEGTVYPILRRLRADGLLSTKWVPSDAGPPRQYYELTDRGRKQLKELRREWSKLSGALNRLLRDGDL